VRILGISGSLRSGSYNGALLGAAATELPPGVVLERFSGLKEVPPFDEDDDHEPALAPVARLRAAIAGADALLVATPEYNSSIPGQLKNAVDWASRPFPKNALRNLPVAVIGASTSMFGGLWSQAEMRKALGAAGARVLGVELAVPHADRAFGPDGTLLDDGARARLREVLRELVGEARPAEARAG
jgi:chromate reductase